MDKRSFSNLLLRRNISILLSSLLITAIIICFVNINSAGSDRIDNAENLLSAYQNSMDKSIKLVTNVVYQTTHEQFFYEYLLSSDEINFYTLQIQKSLNIKLSSIENYCYSVGLMKNGSSFMLSNRNSAVLDSYLREINVTKETYNSFAESVPDSANGVYYFIDSENPNSPYITLGTKFTYSGNGSIVILLSFYKEYFSSPFDKYDRFFMISNGKIVFDNKTGGNPVRISEAVKVAGMSGLSRTDISRKKLARTMYLTVPSIAVDCRYILAVHLPRTQLYGNLLLIISALFILAFIAFVISSTRRLAKPIDETVDTLRAFSGVENNSDDLSTLNNTAENIIRENRTLASKLDSRTQSLKNHFITDLLLGVLTDDEIRSGINEYEIDFANETITVCMLDFDYDLSGNIALDTAELQSVADELCSSRMVNNPIGALVLFKSKYILLLRGLGRVKLSELFEALLSALKREYSLDAVAAIGTPTTGVLTWKDSFNVALNLLEHKYSLSFKRVLMPDNLSQIEVSSFYYPLDIEQLLINNVISCEQTKLRLILSDVLSKNFRGGNLSKELLLEFTQAMAYTINRCLQRINANISDVYEDGTIIYLELRMCTTENELREKLFYMFDMIMDYIHSNSPQGCKLSAESFAKYISQNYQSDISLADVAEFYDLSVPYTSKTIKQVTGQNFKEYLNSFRIAKAKTLFTENSDIKINQVAKNVGFVNVNSFIRVFKAIEGVSPGAFKKGSPDDEKI